MIKVNFPLCLAKHHDMNSYQEYMELELHAFLDLDTSHSWVVSFTLQLYYARVKAKRPVIFYVTSNAIFIISVYILTNFYFFIFVTWIFIIHLPKNTLLSNIQYNIVIIKIYIRTLFYSHSCIFRSVRTSSGSLYWAWPKLYFCRNNQ